MYKDKDKQREATKAAVKRHRVKQGITQPASEQGITSGITQPPEVINGKYNRAYLPGGQYYVGCCYQKALRTKRHYLKRRGWGQGWPLRGVRVVPSLPAYIWFLE